MSEWINVKDRIPAEHPDADYLVYDGQSIQVLNWKNGKFTAAFSLVVPAVKHEILFKPTHWMPLPEPPIETL